jgi:hypothetical protein
MIQTTRGLWKGSIDLVLPNHCINSDWQLRYAPLPAGYAGR